jgi:hypothetical protein
MRSVFPCLLAIGLGAAAPLAHAAPGGTKSATPAASSVPSATASASPAAPAPPMDEARRLYEEGTAELNAGHYAQAAEKLRAAWAKKKSYDVAGNLGTALVQLGKRAEAARLLAYAVANFPAGGSPKERKWAEDTLADVRKEVVLLRVRVSVDGAEVSVNGEAVGTSPLAEETYAEPGAVVVVAKKDGFEDARVEMQGDKGGTLEPLVTMRAKSGPSPEPNRLPAYIAFGAGGVGLVLGAITGGITVAKTNDLNGACGPSKVCPASAHGDFDTALALSRVATVSLVVAGVGAALGATLLVVSDRKAQTSASVIAGPSFIGVKGAF